MDLIDSHCHFDFSNFDVDRSQQWQVCQQAGIRQMIIPGVSPSQWCIAQHIAESLAGVHFAVGLHPWYIVGCESDLESDLESELDSDLEQSLIESLDHNLCIAIGECGLDKAKQADIPWQRQEQILCVHLRVAALTSTPLILHSVKAHAEMIALLKQYSLSAGGVIHGFSGSVEQAQAYWKLGFYIGVGNVICHSRANKTRRAIASMPLASLLLETDSPSRVLSHKQHASNVIVIAETLAQLHNKTLQEVASITSGNSRTLFSLPKSESLSHEL